MHRVFSSSSKQTLFALDSIQLIKIVTKKGIYSAKYFIILLFITHASNFPAFYTIFFNLFFCIDIFYWQLIRASISLADKNEWKCGTSSNMPHYYALVPSLVSYSIYFEWLKTNKVNIDLTQFVNQSPFNESNGKQQLTKNKIVHAIDLHINTLTLIRLLAQ